MAQAKPRENGKAKTPLLEWIAAGVGLLLTLAMLAVIGREAWMNGSDQAPSISVAVTGITATSTNYVVAFEARNMTGGPAAAVEIEAVIMDRDIIVETSKATLDYVAGYGKAQGGVVFTKDPRQHALIIRARGFQTP